MTIETYINNERGPYPFCPGCSHGKILDAINEALLRFQPSPSDVVIVTDIGCTGLSDQWFITSAFHGLHGRSVVYGEGLSLASPDTHVIVLMGDGGAGVGLHHLVSAARRNINMTVILFNNFNFGMTGGEHSITSPVGARTSSSRNGNVETSARIAETLQVNDASFTARRSIFDKDLTDIIETALLHKGFAFVEVLELCTAYFSPFNDFWKKDIEKLLDSATMPRMLEVKDDRSVYNCNATNTEQAGKNARLLNPEFQNRLNEDLTITVSGSAGQKIQSTATLFAVSAILSGLFVIQKDDYPVTIKSGYSMSTLKFSLKPSEYSGSGIPDLLFILSIDGHKKAAPIFKRMGAGSTIFLFSDLPDIETDATVIRVELKKTGQVVTKNDKPLAVLASWLKKSGIFSHDALKYAVSPDSKAKIREKMIEIIELSDPEVFDSA